MLVVIPKVDLKMHDHCYLQLHDRRRQSKAFNCCFLRAKADGRVTYDFDIDGLLTMIKKFSLTKDERRWEGSLNDLKKSVLVDLKENYNTWL